MILSKQKLPTIKKTEGLDIPSEAIFALPEKVLQFGTGVLLRCLPDYFIDKANKQGIFNGRIVIVKSTSQGDSDAFGKQDNLYTQCVRGIENGKRVDGAVINDDKAAYLNGWVHSKLSLHFFPHPFKFPSPLRVEGKAERQFGMHPNGLWDIGNTNNFVGRVLEDTNLWGASLDALPGFRAAVAANIKTIETKGIARALQKFLVKYTLQRFVV